MAEVLDRYVPREFKIPTAEEVLLRRKGPKMGMFSRGGLIVLDRRALRWLRNAAFYANATLNVVINLYPEDESRREYFEPILEELAAVIKNAQEDGLEEGELEGEALIYLIRNAQQAVAHAGNVFNNTCTYLPKEVLRAVLEARDICDEAVRQPNFVAY